MIHANSFQGDIVHLGENFEREMQLDLDNPSCLLSNKILQTMKTTIYKEDSKFTFNRNGFEFCSFQETPFGNAIADLSKDPMNEETPCWENRTFARKLEEKMEKWGRNNGLDFSSVVWVDTVYRDTMKGKFKAVHFAHVDFPPNEYTLTLQGHSNWQDRVGEKLTDMTPDNYEKLNVSRIVNLWMPLDQRLEAEPLALMDTQSLSDPNNQLGIYEDRRKSTGETYRSVGIIPAPEHKWYIQKQMTLGDGVIFDCCKTPHTAVSLPEQGNKSRTSAECRVLFLQTNTP